MSLKTELSVTFCQSLKTIHLTEEMPSLIWQILAKSKQYNEILEQGGKITKARDFLQIHGMTGRYSGYLEPLIELSKKICYSAIESNSPYPPRLPTYFVDNLFKLKKMLETASIPLNYYSESLFSYLQKPRSFEIKNAFYQAMYTLNEYRISINSACEIIDNTLKSL